MKTRPYWLCFVVTCLCLGIAFSGFSQDRTVRISTGEYAPWTSEFLLHGGFVNHVITEAFQLEGYTVIFQYFPWKRAYKEAKDGRYQATSFWADTEKEYSKYFYRSDPVSQAKVVFFHLRSNPMRPWNKITDLHVYTIGTMLGETATKILKQAGLPVQDVVNAEQNIKKLLMGRINLFPLEVVTGLDLLQAQLPPEQAALITYNPKPLFETPASLMFSKQVKGNQAIVAIFNRGLATLRQNGKYDELYQDLLSGKYKK